MFLSERCHCRIGFLVLTNFELSPHTGLLFFKLTMNGFRFVAFSLFSEYVLNLLTTHISMTQKPVCIKNELIGFYVLGKLVANPF